MTPTDRKVHIDIMNLLFTYLSSVSINRITDIYCVYNVIQNKDEETKNHHQQQPCQNSNKVSFDSKMTSSSYHNKNLEADNQRQFLLRQTMEVFNYVA